MNYKRLQDDIAYSIAMNLHYMDGFDRISSLKTSAEVREAIDGGAARFGNDTFFQRRVESLTFTLMQVIRENIQRSDSETKKPPVKEANL